MTPFSAMAPVPHLYPPPKSGPMGVMDFLVNLIEFYSSTSMDRNPIKEAIGCG